MLKLQKAKYNVPIRWVLTIDQKLRYLLKEINRFKIPLLASEEIFLMKIWSFLFQATLSLLERVLMKDIVTPVAPEEVRSMIQTSLENAALLNYTQLSQKANIEGTVINST